MKAFCFSHTHKSNLETLPRCEGKRIIFFYYLGLGFILKFQIREKILFFSIKETLVEDFYCFK